VAETGLPIPKPSYNFLDASSRGERGISLDEEDRGVVGEDDLTEESEEWVSASVSSSVVSMVTAGMGWETAALKRSG